MSLLKYLLTWRIEYGDFRMDFNIDVYIHNWMLCWNYCFGTFKE